MKGWINYHHLLYFKVIATEGGIAKAAKKLRLGQPTLSTQLKQFEHALGYQLFDRSKRSLVLTEPGRLVLGYANDIFKMGDEMLDILSDFHENTKMQVQIGIADSVPKQLAWRIYEKVKSHFDAIATIVTGHANEMIRELRALRLDIVVANLPPPPGDSAGFLARSVARMPLIVCGSPKYVKLRQGFPASLNGTKFILPTLECKLRTEIDHFFKMNDIHVDTVAEVQDPSLQKIMAMHHEGLIAIAEPAVEDWIKNKELTRIGKLTDVYDELWLLTAKRRMQNPIANKMMREFNL